MFSSYSLCLITITTFVAIYPSKYLSFGGGKEDRTPDPLLAKQVLSQLSYTPILKPFRSSTCYADALGI